MRIFYFSTLITIILDIFAWFIIQLSIAKWSLKFKDSFLSNKTLFKVFTFEKDGLFYEKFFKIRLWKDKAFDGTKILKQGFSKKTLLNKDPQYLNRFLLEINRGELSHWLQILPAPLFFLFNLPLVGWLMVLYAIVANLPFILIQRYNRARLSRIVK